MNDDNDKRLAKAKDSLRVLLFLVGLFPIIAAFGVDSWGTLILVWLWVIAAFWIADKLCEW